MGGDAGVRLARDLDQAGPVGILAEPPRAANPAYRPSEAAPGPRHGPADDRVSKSYSVSSSTGGTVRIVPIKTARRSKFY